MNLVHVLFFYLIAMAMPFASAGGMHTHSETGPRIDTFTSSFELVGHLQEDELSILIDRYETNEPVLNGVLEVELNGLKAPAKFHADHGDYAVADENFLKVLAHPGKHALVFTLTLGDERDRLEGVLEVRAADEHHDDSDEYAFSLNTWVICAVFFFILSVALAIRMLRCQSNSGR